MTDVIALALLLQAGPGLPPVTIEPPSITGEWVVERIGNIQVLPESHVTIRIEPGGASSSASISGQGPCNSYRGTMTLGVTAGVKISALLRTMKACDTARMGEEDDFFRLLAALAAFDVRDDLLTLSTDDGRTLHARRASGPPRH